MSDINKSKNLNVVVSDDQSVGEVSDYDEKPSLWRRIIKKLEVQEKGDLTSAQMFLYNHDLKPVEEERRTWVWYHYVFFWIADSFNISTWQIAASGVDSMGVWMTWGSVWLGYFLAGVFVQINARVGPMYHISFPVLARSSFGLYGSLYAVVIRIFLSCLWYSIQTAVAGPCVEVMLESIFGNDLNERIPDHISGYFTSFQFISLFIFWFCSLPFLWLQPHQLKYVFSIKAYICPLAGVLFLVWTVVKAGGIGPIVRQGPKAEGSELAWAFVQSTMNSLANFVTLIANAPDFSRFSRAPTFSIKYLVYTVSIPVCFSLTSLIGILVSSASAEMYDEPVWSPIEVLSKFLRNYTSGNRAGVFFLGLVFAFSQLGTNLSANSLSFGTDITSLIPRFMTIRRGSYICGLLAIALNPWELNTADTFITALAAFAVFLSAVVGVMVADYYVVRRGFLKLTHLYSLTAPEKPGSDSFYRYNKWGINWRAFAAYFCGLLPNITGFVGATGQDVPMGATYIYRFNYFVGFFTSFFIYAILCYFFPVAGVPQGPFGKGWFEEWQDVEDFEEELKGHVIHPGLEESLSYSSGRKAEF